MAEAIAFDTHRFVKNLTEHGGFTMKQAEVLAAEQVNLLNTNLATKADVAEIYASIEKRRAATRFAGVNESIANLKTEFVMWLVGALIAHAGLMVALIRFA